MVFGGVIVGQVGCIVVELLYIIGELFMQEVGGVFVGGSDQVQVGEWGYEVFQVLWCWGGWVKVCDVVIFGVELGVLLCQKVMLVGGCRSYVCYKGNFLWIMFCWVGWFGKLGNCCVSDYY